MDSKPLNPKHLVLFREVPLLACELIRRRILGLVQDLNIRFARATIPEQITPDSAVKISPKCIEFNGKSEKLNSHLVGHERGNFWGKLWNKLHNQYNFQH
jgi:hypothetical protein